MRQIWGKNNVNFMHKHVQTHFLIHELAEDKQIQSNTVCLKIPLPLHSTLDPEIKPNRVANTYNLAVLKQQCSDRNSK